AGAPPTARDRRAAPRCSGPADRVTRPGVSVVMPFAGTRDAAERALEGLGTLDTNPGDELLLVDNSGTLAAAPPAPDGRVRIVRADAERSPAHARNVGAEQARNPWILFLDADCRLPSGLLDAYFIPQAIHDDV